MDKGWNYLTARPFQMRHVIAAHLVQQCKNVVEIGSYKTPIVDFLNGRHGDVYCIDPRLEYHEAISPHIKDGRKIIDRVHMFKEPFETIPDIFHLSDFGLIILGFGFQQMYWAELLDLVLGSEVAVIESWKTWPAYTGFVEYVSGTSKTMTMRLGMDMSGNNLNNPEPENWPARTDRELVVFE